MSAKQFFKSNTFKCLAVLTAVLLVCGIFLTVMNALLEVSAGEKLQRAVKNVYGKSLTVTVYGLDDKGEEVVIDADNKAPQSLIKDTVTVGSAEISEVYKVIYTQNGKEVENYLVTSTGKGGYSGGTVTCSVALVVDDGKVSGIYKVSVQSNKNQSFIGKIKNKFLNSFASDYKDGKVFMPTDGYFSAGATLSSSAIDNAVNGAIEYVNSILDTETAGSKLINTISAFYEKDVTVYGLDASGNEKAVTAEDTEVKSLYAEKSTATATVTEMYKVTYEENGATVTGYVINSTGKGGYQDGTATCLVGVTVTGGSVSAITKVAITGNTEQSYIGNVTEADLNTYKNNFVAGTEFTGKINAAVSYTSVALNNAVNGAISYANANLAGGNN